MGVAPPGGDHTLLAATELTMADPVDAVPLLDTGRSGVVADRPRPGVVRRAEPGPAGPIVCTATQRDARVALAVRGPASTPAAVHDVVMEQAHGWIGARDEPVDLIGPTAGHAALHCSRVPGVTPTGSIDGCGRSRGSARGPPERRTACWAIPTPCRWATTDCPGSSATR